jgi:hypothetical protein
VRPVAGRAHAQSLDRPRFDSLVDVVRHLGCVQSQLHDMALWGVGRRLRDGATLAQLQHSFDAGEVVRTHVLRPTWHLVAPDDLHWLQALTGPRVRRLVETTNRSIGLSSDVVERGAALVVEILADGRPRTRRELMDALTASGFVLTGQAMAHVVMSAEIDAAIVSGPMAGKQHTYRLAEQRVVGSRDDLLAEVARRYALGHGPVRDRDLAWWTSLTLTDSRRAIELGELRPVDVDDVTHWAVDEPVPSQAPAVMLLPNFDEYISYARDADDYAGIAGTSTEVMRATGLLFVHGRLAGSWTRTLGAGTVAIDVRPATPMTASLRRGVQTEADAFGRFVGREPRLSIAD